MRWNQILSALVVCGVLAGSAVQAGAVPACPEPVTVTQPDGSDLTVYVRGDERFHFMTDEDGYVIAQNDAGDYVYETTGRRRSSALASDSGTGRPAGALHMSAMPVLEQVEEDAMAPALQAEVSLENRPLLTILVEFTDMKLDSRYDASFWYNKFFGTTGKTIHTYYTEMSNGTFTFEPAADTQGADDGIVTVLLSYDHPQPERQSDAENNRLTRQIARDALLAADAYVDFAAYDTNGNGYLSSDELVISYLVAGYEAAAGEQNYAVWAHQWNLGSNPVYCDRIWLLNKNDNDASQEGNYIMQGERLGTFKEDYPNGLSGAYKAVSTAQEIGTLCHELGHTLGLPDLYNTADGQKAEFAYMEPYVGHLSLMATGSWGYVPGEKSGATPTHLDPWCRMQLGWLTPTVLGQGQTGIFEAASFDTGDYEVYQIPTGKTGEYFLVENRQKTGFDAGMIGGGVYQYVTNPGLAIWHVDEAVIAAHRSKNEINSYYETDGQGMMLMQQGFVPYESDPSDDEITHKWNALHDMLWFRGPARYNAFSVASVANSRLSPQEGVRADSGVRIEVLSDSGPRMTFAVENNDWDLYCSRENDTGTLRVINNTGEAVSRTLTPIVAVHDASGALVDLRMQPDVAIEAEAYGMSDAIVFSGLATGEGYTYTFYLWDSLSSMVPLVRTLVL